MKLNQWQLARGNRFAKNVRDDSGRPLLLRSLWVPAALRMFLQMTILSHARLKLSLVMAGALRS